MQSFLWLAVILVSAGTAYLVVRPTKKEVAALKSMCEMLARAVRGDFDKK